MFLCRNCCLHIIIQKIAPQAESGQHFQTQFEGKNGGVLSMRMQVIVDFLFARPDSAPIWGGKKEEFRDWTRCTIARLFRETTDWRREFRSPAVERDS